jgi:hypothetical protein
MSGKLVDERRSVVAQALRGQAEGCRLLGSRLYGDLLDRTAADVERGGPAWRVFEPFADWPSESAYVLRVMGAVHRVVLTAEATALAPHFAPGGDGAAAWPAFVELLEGRGDELRDFALAHGVQTNEVGRCAVLAPAILRAAGEMPLRLLEIGSSAGLNLRFDSYRYEDLWGPSDSPVALLDRYEGEPPPFPGRSVEVVERRGCDPAPVDAATESGRLTLLSYVWPDQAERMDLLRGAFAVAANMPVAVDRAPAGEWLERELAEPRAGVATVVFQSIVWQYLADDERTRVRDAISRAGAAATRDAPLAWVRMEPEGELARVDVTSWPGGQERLVARAGYHARPVRWLA